MPIVPCEATSNRAWASSTHEGIASAFEASDDGERVGEVFRLLGVPDSIRMQLCIGTSSLAIIVPTTLRSYHTHEMRGLVLSDVMQQLGAAVDGGRSGRLGSQGDRARRHPQGDLCRDCVRDSLEILIGGERWVVGTELPDPAALSGYGFVIGLASSLMGISGGLLVTMVLTRYGKPAHNGGSNRGRHRCRLR